MNQETVRWWPEDNKIEEPNVVSQESSYRLYIITKDERKKWTEDLKASIPSVKSRIRQSS